MGAHAADELMARVIDKKTGFKGIVVGKKLKILVEPEEEGRVRWIDVDRLEFVKFSDWEKRGFHAND